jgi:hypothetical protein
MSRPSKMQEEETRFFYDVNDGHGFMCSFYISLYNNGGVILQVIRRC